MDSTPLDDLDDSTNLESKVLLALSRLQKENKRPKKRAKINEVSCKKVVAFLKANYSWLDGDVESQVITALLSCVKTGLVCALENGKYRLMGPSSKTMISNCVTRTSHGSKCCCLTMLKTTSYICCHLKRTENPMRKPKKTVKKKPPMRPRSRSRSSPRQSVKKKPASQNKCQIIKCALTAQKLFGTSKSAIALSGENTDSKCTYCSEIHSLSKSRKICVTCYPFGAVHGVPYDKFSPRDELVSNLSLNTEK